MLRFFICVISLNLTVLVFSQNEPVVAKHQNIPEVRADKNFSQKYKRKLDLLIRTYPMALKAKELIDEYEGDLSEIDKKRKKRKYGRKAHNSLKDQFTYNIRDLYRSEGGMLMKLVHRETGMTVHEIIERYRGSASSGMYTGIAKIWGHDIKSTYDPKSPDNDDWITELVIKDIQAGHIEFDTEMRRMNKAEYKESMKDYREGSREYRRNKRKEKYKKRKEKK